jgi:hypothetical protein
MDFSATLTDAEIETLSDHSRSLQDARAAFHAVNHAAGNTNESVFEKSLRTKNTLDAFEQSSRTTSSRHVLAIVVNCEYLLWCLNSDTPLVHNPFLSHWVEAIQRLDVKDAQERSPPVYTGGDVPVGTAADRVMWIKTLLQGDDLDYWGNCTPSFISNSLELASLSEPFDLNPYIQMLENEGIYEKTSEPDTTASSSTAHTSTDPSSPSRGLEKPDQSFEDSAEVRKQGILHMLEKQPDAAIFEITRLPITLTYLDFITTILTDRLLEKHSIDPAAVITQYIQHSLRTVERMDKPPSPSSESNAELCAHPETLEYGKEAQSRCILLLLLFIKSLIRKGLIELDVLFYEIAEITVRYVWIKEVREFRTWAEEGIEVDGSG